MSPSLEELAIIVRLLRDVMRGGLVQKITQPADTTLLFDLYNTGAGKLRVLVDLRPQDVRFHPTSRKFASAGEASAFCLLLRKLLKNGRVRSLEVSRDDRVVTLGIDKMEDDVVHRRQVVVELLPRAPGLYVLDDANVILAASRSIHDADRDLARGRTWSAPGNPAPPAKALPFARFPEWTDTTIFDCLDGEVDDAATVGVDIRALRKEVTRAVKRQIKRVSKVEEDLRKSQDGEGLRLEGELLKANLHEIARGQVEVTLADWTAPAGEEREVTITLDPRLGPRENLERIFGRAKKLIRGREVIAERLEEQRTRLRELNRLDADLEHGDPEALVARARALGIEPPAKPVTPARKAAEKPAPRKPYLVFVSRDGLEIWVGRTSRENDLVTFKHARGNEWWLHAADYAGSHVIVKTEGELPEQTLLDAATLAVRFSKAGSGGKQSVSYTRRKWVSKFRGAAPGKVLLQQHKTLLVRMESDRLERLEASRRQA